MSAPDGSGPGGVSAGPGAQVPGAPSGPPGDGKPGRRPLLVTLIPLLALVGLLAWVGINSLKTDAGSSRGPKAGTPMPPFAAPLAASGPDSDVNVATRSGEGAAGSRPACDVRGPGILNSCDLVARRPAALAFVAAGDRRCAGGYDTLAAAARGTGVRPAAIIVRGSRADARRMAAAPGWEGPVGWDRDGVLANLYGVAVCPQVVYLRRGGTVEGTRVGSATRRRLHADLVALARSSR